MQHNGEFKATNHHFMDALKLDLNHIRQIMFPCHPLEIAAALLDPNSDYFKLTLNLLAQQLLLSTLLLIIIRECLRRTLEIKIEEREALTKEKFQAHLAEQEAYHSSWTKQFEAEKIHANKAQEESLQQVPISSSQLKTEAQIVLTPTQRIEQIKTELKSYDEQLQKIQAENHQDFLDELSKVTIYNTDGEEINEANHETLVNLFEESKANTDSNWLQTMVNSHLIADAATKKAAEDALGSIHEGEKERKVEDPIVSKETIAAKLKLLPDPATIVHLRNMVASLKMVHQGIPGKTANTPTVSNLEVLHKFMMNKDELMGAVQNHVKKIQSKEEEQIIPMMKLAVEQFLLKDRSPKAIPDPKPVEFPVSAAKLREIGGWQKSQSQSIVSPPEVDAAAKKVP